jgi:hypothetical protein
MAWKQVDKYWLGYEQPSNQFLFYYQLAGDTTVNQFFPTPEALEASAEMFRENGPIWFSTTGNYFVTNPENVGEEQFRRRAA